MTIKSIQLVESIYGQIINGIQLNITEADAENNSFQMLLDEYVHTGEEGAKPFYINLENAKYGKSVLLSSEQQMLVNRNLLIELDDMGISYDIITANQVN